MRCKICDFCAETHEYPTNNKVVIDELDGEPICLHCLHEVKEINDEFDEESKQFNGGTGEPALPKV